MTRISSKALDQKLSQKLFAEFVQYITKTNRQSIIDFLETVLTRTECIMLAKRVAVIAMLHDGCSVYRIAQVLEMSTSTISGMKRKYELNQYIAITSRMGMSKKEREKFWKTLEIILRAGMPPRGRDRWKWLDTMT